MTDYDMAEGKTRESVGAEQTDPQPPLDIRKPIPFVGEMARVCYLHCNHD